MLCLLSYNSEINIAGWSSLVARWAHNPEVGGSNPPPATNLITRSGGVVVNMPVCHTGDRGFNSRPDRHYHGSVAQLVEQWTENPCVASSILARTTIENEM